MVHLPIWQHELRLTTRKGGHTNKVVTKKKEKECKEIVCWKAERRIYNKGLTTVIQAAQRFVALIVRGSTTFNFLLMMVTESSPMSYFHQLFSEAFTIVELIIKRTFELLRLCSNGNIVFGSQTFGTMINGF